MRKRRILKASDLNGIAIYQDPKKGTVYYDYLTGRAFSLCSQDAKTYMLYEACLPVSILVASIIYVLFQTKGLTAIIIGVFVYLALKLAFRIFFFWKLPEIKNWQKPKKDNLILRMANRYSKTRLIILLVCLLLLTVCMILYARMENMQGLLLFAMYGLSVVTFAGAVLTIIALVVQAKNNASK